MRATSLAQGMTYWTVTLLLHVGLRAVAVPAAARLRPSPPPAPGCAAPVAVATPNGLRLGCADEPAWATLGVAAFDCLTPDGAGGFRRRPYGMPLGWYTSLGHRFDLNQAQVEHLQGLPHIGVQTARAIVRYRQQHGPYATFDDLAAVRGVGVGRVQHLRRFVTLSNGG